MSDSSLHTTRAKIAAAAAPKAGGKNPDLTLLALDGPHGPFLAPAGAVGVGLRRLVEELLLAVVCEHGRGHPEDRALLDSHL